MKRMRTILMCIVLTLIVVSCGPATPLPTPVACEQLQLETVIEGPVDMPNPAAFYCTGLGYEHTTREREIGEQGIQSEPATEPTPETLEDPQPSMPVVPDYIIETVCVFRDGNECEEWDFLSGRCGQEYSYCVQQGYTLEPGPNGATCIFPDGSSCLEIEFIEGDCEAGEQ